MDVADLIDRLGGSKAVQGITGLSKGRISQWRTENHIPRPWLKFLQSSRPELFQKQRAKRERRIAA